MTTMRMTAAQRREQILDVTKAIVGADGFHAVSIDRVARESGITRPVVYGHFHDLGGLLEALVDRESARVQGQLLAILPTHPEPGEQPVEVLVRALGGYLEAVLAEPVAWRLVLMPAEGAPALLRERIAEGRAAAVAVLADLAGGALGAGTASPDPELTGRAMSALSDEAARLVLTDPERYPVDRVIAHTRWWLERFLS